MEYVDIEDLNFDVYNREVYHEQSSRAIQNSSQFEDPQRRYGKEIDKFVEDYYKNIQAKNDEENLERIKKRKY